MAVLQLGEPLESPEPYLGERVSGGLGGEGWKGG